MLTDGIMCCCDQIHILDETEFALTPSGPASQLEDNENERGKRSSCARTGPASKREECDSPNPSPRLFA